MRVYETVDDNWKRIFRFEFGTLAVLGSLISFIMLVFYLNDTGGWTLRTLVLTREYFDWHPLLMGIAFLLFMTPAVLSFEVFPFVRHTNKNIHGLLNTLGFVAAIAGFAIILDCHQNLSTKGSFHTLHSAVGVTTLGFYFINLSLAIILYVMGCGGSLRGSLKPLHKRLGFLTILCGYSTICIGLMEDSLTKFGDARRLSYAIGIGVYLTAAGVIFSICNFIEKKDVNADYTPIDIQERPTAGSGVTQDDDAESTSHV